MFPVDFKDKLPRTESYPLRAKELWDALGSVPQSEAIGLSFVRPMHWGRYKERPRSWGKRPTALQVLSATYGGPVPLSITTSNEMITSTFLNRRWHMTVFAVPR